MSCIQIDDKSTTGNEPLGLRNVLQAFSNVGAGMNWHLLELEARGRLRGNRSVVEFETEISASPVGVAITWSKLTELGDDLDDVINFLAVGSARLQAPTSRDTRELAEVYDVVVERFDSTYWRMYSRLPEHSVDIRHSLPSSHDCTGD